jgi:hypothetical protein
MTASVRVLVDVYVNVFAILFARLSGRGTETTGKTSHRF